MNLYKETLHILEENNKSIDDIDFLILVDCDDSNIWDVKDEDYYSTDDIQKFILWCNRYSNYDDEFGGVEIPINVMVIFKDNSWIERHEYDGSEWWEYKETPKRVANV